MPGCAPGLSVLAEPGFAALRSSEVTVTAVVDLDNGAVTLELRCGTASLRPERSAETERRDATNQFWSD